MKKIFTTVSVFLLFLVANSQSNFQLLDELNGYNDVTNTTEDIWLGPGDNVVRELEVKNLASTSKLVRCKRTFVSGIGTVAPNQDTVELCWNLCLAPTWNAVQTAGNVTIAAGDTASFAGNGIGFHVTFKPSMIVGVRTVRFTFYDNANTTDSVNYIINYHITAVGVAETDTKSFNFSNAYPNPATSVATIKYDFSVQAKTKIKLYNAVGSLVKEFKIEDQNGKLNINTDELSNGLYFYSLIVNDKVTGTKKLIVAH
ncbi:MAG: T9SS type A sorting domain-containing protein [Bacteroidia bacterium]|nr:T9SS type A sorting domain-containing protein [Bacteroidia bacterium]